MLLVKAEGIALVIFFFIFCGSSRIPASGEKQNETKEHLLFGRVPTIFFRNWAVNEGQISKIWHDRCIM